MYLQVINLLLLVTCSITFGAECSCNLAIGKNGTFTLSAFTEAVWLHSGPIAFMMKGKWRSTGDSTLVFIKDSARKTTGQDTTGYYTEYSFQYQTENVTMETAIRQYNSTSMILFIQRFPHGLSGSRTDFNKVMTAFPTFRLDRPKIPLGYLAFGGFMFGDHLKHYGRWDNTFTMESGIESGPVTIFDKNGNALIISPFDHFMAASANLDEDYKTLNWGIMGGVDSLPVGFKYSTVVFCSHSGIGQAFTRWGQVLRQKYNKTDDVVHYHQSHDDTINYLGYWTDNGAVYHYHTEPNKTYEETLLEFKDWATKNSVPFRYVQIDSWFYPKDHRGAVTTWDAMPKVFPSGFKGFQEKLQLPLVVHNKFWSVNATYAKQNGGKYDFFIGENLSLPLDPALWDFLMRRGHDEWNLRVYEQDWLNIQFENTEILKTNLTVGRLWLKQMADAAQRNDLSIQYCLSLSKHAMQSLEFPTVTQARVSEDYKGRSDQWKIGIVSHFAHAMRVVPFKDTFWTIHKQPGYKTKKREDNPNLQVLISVLSSGPVGPGDRVGYTDVDLLMKCCNQNGLILKPSVPAKAIDDQFIGMAFGKGSGVQGEVYSTYSTHLDTLYGIIFSTNLIHEYEITPRKAGFLADDAPKFVESVLFSIQGHKVTIHDYAINDNSKIPIKISNSTTTTKRVNFVILYIFPKIIVGNHTVTLFGDIAKWVPMSEQRVPYIWKTVGGLAVTVRGKEGESIQFHYSLDHVYYTKSGTANQKECWTFTVIQDTGPLYPTNIDCRIKDHSFKETTISKGPNHAKQTKYHDVSHGNSNREEPMTFRVVPFS